jgi:hypothetical protein
MNKEVRNRRTWASAASVAVSIGVVLARVLAGHFCDYNVEMASYQTEKELRKGIINWNNTPNMPPNSTTRQSRVNCMRDPSKCPGYNTKKEKVGFGPLTVRQGGSRRRKSKRTRRR